MTQFRYLVLTLLNSKIAHFDWVKFNTWFRLDVASHVMNLTNQILLLKGKLYSDISLWDWLPGCCFKIIIYVRKLFNFYTKTTLNPIQEIVDFAVPTQFKWKQLVCAWSNLVYSQWCVIQKFHTKSLKNWFGNLSIQNKKFYESLWTEAFD